LNSEDFAKLLMAEERREWQNPEEIIEQIGVAAGSSAADLACGPDSLQFHLRGQLGVWERFTRWILILSC